MEALLQDKNLKRICIIIILSLWAWSVIGGNPVSVSSIPAEIQINSGDSVGVKTIEGKSFVVYRMGKGETAYAVSRKFGVPYKEIAAANNGVDMGALKVGQEILVPVSFNQSGPVTTNSSNSQIAETPKQETKEEKIISDPLTASATENKTEIAAQTNQAKQEEIISPESTSITEETTSGSSADKSNSFAMQFAAYQSGELTAVSEKGAATWIENNGIEPTGDRFYALSNSAPVGSIIKVRNMMNNRIVFAKVIGKLSETEVNAKVMVKLSAGAGERLNVLDSRFVVEVTYYKSEE